MRSSRFLKFLTIIIFTCVMTVSLPTPDAEARCGVGCTYNIANRTITGAITQLISYLGGGFTQILTNLQNGMQSFFTQQFTEKADQDSVERRAVADASMTSAIAQVNAMDAMSSNDRQGLRQAAMEEVNRGTIGEVEGACLAMSRTQSMSPARIHARIVDGEVARETERLNAGYEGYLGSSGGPLEFHNMNIQNWAPYMGAQSMDGNLTSLVLEQDSLKHKASLSAGSNLDVPEQKHNKIVKAFAGAVGTAPAELAELDVSPGRLTNKLSIEMGGDVQKAFQALINHMGGGPTEPISNAVLTNPSSSTGQILGEWRAFSGLQNLGVLPFIDAMSKRIVTPGSPQEVIPIFDKMMDDYGFPDILREEYRTASGYSYAAMRELLGVFPVFNPEEFAKGTLIGDQNVQNQTLLYQGFTTAFIVDMLEQQELTNMLLGAMLLRDVNDEDRSDVQNAIRRLGGSAGVSYTPPAMDADDDAVTHFINAAIDGTDALMDAPAQ